MSVRQLLITDPTNADYGKISPLYIPTSIRPLGNDAALGAIFADITNEYTIESGNEIFKFATEQITVSDKFNFLAPKMGVSISANISLKGNQTNTNFIQTKPQGIYFKLFNNSVPASISNIFYIQPVDAVNGQTVEPTNGFVQWSFSINDIITPIGWVDNIDTLQVEFILNFDTPIAGNFLTGTETHCDASLVLTPCL